jgi:hypothetical protein
MDRGLKRKGFAVIGVLLFCAMAMKAHAATITVINTNDSGPGSLRQALANANNGDRINFAVTGTITLTSGGLGVAKNVTISGPGANQLSINGNQATLVFGVPPQRTVSISGLSIRNAQYGISNNQGTVSVGSCVLSGHSVAGLYNFAGQGSGDATHGGIHFVGTQLTVANSTISGNSSVDNGGGIFADGFAVNFPFNVSIGNSTISGNSAGTNGGGIYDVRSLLHVANSTISGNSAGSGGGIYNDGGADGGINGEISNTILNAGASGENIVNNNGLFNSLGYNLSSDDGGGYLNGPGDQINTDPLLGPLQDNSGPTFTHALLPGSPAINQGDPNFTPPPSYDQRGPNFYRVRDLNIDIGSFEVQAGFGPRQRPTPRPRPTPH